MTDLQDEQHTWTFADYVLARGDYLRSTVRTRGLTCRTCTLPVRGYEYCWRCREHPDAGADLVAPLTYAIAGTMSARVVGDYKRHPANAVRARCRGLIAVTTALTVRLHAECLERAVGLPITARTTVPSLTSRPDAHPLTQGLNDIGSPTPELLRAAVDADCGRRISEDKFVLAEDADVVGRHVLLLDDVWTTGSNAQSAAMTLKRAGAAAVTVVVFGRWLNPNHPSTERFIGRGLLRTHEITTCPVTGLPCN